MKNKEIGREKKYQDKIDLKKELLALLPEYLGNEGAYSLEIISASYGKKKDWKMHRRGIFNVEDERATLEVKVMRNKSSERDFEEERKMRILVEGKQRIFGPNEYIFYECLEDKV